ncbi:site-specific integrase, partial [Pseudomonas sp. ATCC 13867]
VDAFRHALDARMPSEVLLKSARESRRRFALACLKLPAQMHLRTPWVDDFARCRNALIVDWLYYLGLRRGELLSLRVSDIDFRRCV